MDIHSMYTIALFANSTYSIVFWYILSFAHQLWVFFLPARMKATRNKNLSAYPPYRARLNVEHGAHQQTQIKY